MQAVAEIMKHLVDDQKSTSLNQQPQGHLTVVPKDETEPLPEKWAQRIFVRMSAIYGYLWTSRHGTEDTWQVARREWSQALAGLTPEQLDHGIVQCRTHHKMPPTLPEFSGLCRQHTSSEAKDDAQREAQYREKIEEQKTKNLTMVCIATRKGWGYQSLTPIQTYAAYHVGELSYEKIKDDLEKFLTLDCYTELGSLAELI